MEDSQSNEERMARTIFARNIAFSATAEDFRQIPDFACEKAFKVIDADNSGNVSPAEISAAVKGVDASAFLAVADKDGDGEISLSEFKAALATDAKFLPLVFAAM